MARVGAVVAGRADCERDPKGGHILHRPWVRIRVDLKFANDGGSHGLQ